MSTSPAFADGVQEGTPTTGVVVPPVAGPPQQFFTAEDLAKVRQQEKDKLYPQLEELRGKVQTWEQQEEARAAEAAAAQAKADEDARKAREDEMSVRELLEQQRADFTAQLAAERAAREQTDALLAQERAYQDLQQYRSDRLEAEQERIIPDLLDLVSGNTPEEIEASIVDMAARSEAILAAAAQATQQARQQQVGPRVTSPAAGPLDTQTGQQTAQLDVRAMTMDEYAKHRTSLLGNASSRGRGLFG